MSLPPSSADKVPIMIVGGRVYPEAPPNLYYSSDEEKGYSRVKKNGKFVFLNTRGKPLKDKTQLKRIDQLVIPPAWTDVWICRLAKGHLQCTGRDLRNRKQAIYHPDWTDYRNQTKFLKLSSFGFALPKLRERVEKDLRKHAWSKEKVIALAIKIMEEGLLRVGNDRYLENNKTYGLTTLRRKHLKEISTSQIQLCYQAKSGKKRTVSIGNKSLVKKLKQCAALCGQEIFRYKGEDKKWHRVDSKDINTYIKDATGEHFTAKTFRTWGGSVSALELINEAKEEVKNSKRKKLETVLVRKVAQKLGNTVSVCRDYYIHPTVLKSVQELESETISKNSKKFIDNVSKNHGPALEGLDYFSEHEKQLLAILENDAERIHQELMSSA